MESQKISSFIKEKAKDIGFDFCGISRAEELTEEARFLEKWLKKGYHGTMNYMERNFEMRIDPRKLFPGVRSVITLLYNYFPSSIQSNNELKISKYAYGNDYHMVIKKKLKSLLTFIQQKAGNINGRGFVDSAPILERTWAERSGLGWIGKNGNLIHKQSGSFFFIATMVTDLILEFDHPFANDYCGSCTRCIDACPTQAILPGKEVEANKCISYFTIELKEALIPQEMKGKFNNWIFGCDICQDVCPWNRFSKPNNEVDFKPIPEILNFSSKQWEELTAEVFNDIFNNSPLKRTGFKGIQRNLRFVNYDPEFQKKKGTNSQL